MQFGSSLFLLAPFYLVHIILRSAELAIVAIVSPLSLAIENCQTDVEGVTPVTTTQQQLTSTPRAPPSLPPSWLID